MKRLALALILTGLGMMMCGLAATAQGTSETEDVYAETRAWMRLAETDRRCSTLFFFEIRAIEKNLDSRLEKTPEYRAAMASAGTVQFDEKFKAQLALYEKLRIEAQEATASTSCSAGENPIFNEARGLYMRDLLKFTIIENAMGARMQAPSAYRVAYNQFAQFLQQVYGDAYESVASQIITELNAAGAIAPDAWKTFSPYLADVYWQEVLASKGFKMGQHRTGIGWYQFFKNEAPVEEFGKFGRPVRSRINDGDKARTINMFVARGRMADDRIAVVYVYTNPGSASVPLSSTILAANEPGWSSYDNSNFRENTQAFEGELLPSEECPGHICFVYPKELSELIKSRQEAGELYYYEIYSGLIEAFPPELTSQRQNREQLIPPRFGVD